MTAGPATTCKIWLVDDSPTQAAFAERVLGVEYQYERFGDGESVLARVDAGAALPDLVLLDWVLPGISGDEVCRYLRATPQSRDLPIVIMTASRTGSEDIATALQSGANDYVSKPFGQAELQARIGAIMRTSALKRAAQHEQRRVEALNELARALFLAGSQVQAILDEVARWLVTSVSDRCTVTLVETGGRTRVVTRSRSNGDASPGVAEWTHELTVRELATCTVALSRDADAAAFDASDVAAVATCLEYSVLAIEAALRSEAERATTRFHEEMLGFVSHDLRSPLSAIGLGIGFLQETVPDPEARGVLARLERTAGRMTSMVEQLLDVTRSRVGRGIPVELAPMALRALVTTVIEEMQLSRPDARYVVHGDEVEGRWDRGRLAQVVSNLAGNAAQYGKPGGTIKIAIECTDAAAALSFHNQNLGAPIDDGLLETLFDPFQRGGTHENLQGLGLGLYIAHQIVRAHRGSITATSGVDGTTFRVSLPRR